MDFNNYPEYAAIAKHIRYARIERAVMIADSLADFIVGAWRALQAPPAPAPIIIDRRRETRADGARTYPRLARP